MSNVAYIGLGLILNKIRYHTVVAIRKGGYGYRARCYITRIKCSDEQLKCMEVWANMHGLTLMNSTKIENKEDLGKWLDVLEPYIHLLDSDMRKGYLKVKWMHENPLPLIPKNMHRYWNQFYDWVRAWDAYNEEIDD